MSLIEVNDPAEAARFVEKVGLAPRQEAARERGLESRPPRGVASAAQLATSQPQAIVVGSQIAEFTAAVAAPLRPHIANAFLLAQLAADKHVADVGGGTSQWYQRYALTLAHTGFVVEEGSSGMKEVSGTTLHLHQELIPILGAVLGPQVVAAALITDVLKRLQAADENRPWFTLFDRHTQRVNANQFQITHVDAPGGTPRMVLACFELDARRAVTRVLFFRFSTGGAKLRHFTTHATFNEPVFNRVKGVIESRVAAHVSDFLAELKL